MTGKNTKAECLLRDLKCEETGLCTKDDDVVLADHKLLPLYGEGAFDLVEPYGGAPMRVRWGRNPQEARRLTKPSPHLVSWNILRFGSLAEAAAVPGT